MPLINEMTALILPSWMTTRLVRPVPRGFRLAFPLVESNVPVARVADNIIRIQGKDDSNLPRRSRNEYIRINTARAQQFAFSGLLHTRGDLLRSVP